jgi:hypothetical protein
MNLFAIDWPNIAATLTATVLGGLIAVFVAQRQIKASQANERQRIVRDIARDLIESLDSFLHIAYRGDGEEHRERERLARRILSLCALCIPERFDAMQEHLGLVEQWWRAKRKNNGRRVRGVGYSATQGLFAEIKESLFLQVFGVTVRLTREAEEDGELPF